MYVSCRGTPFTLTCSRVSQSKPTCGEDNDIPLQCVDAYVPTRVLVLAGTYAAARCSPQSGPEGRALHAAEPTVIVSGKKAVAAMTCPGAIPLKTALRVANHDVAAETRV